MRSTFAVVLTVVTVVAASCAGCAARQGLDYLRVTMNGQQALGVSRPGIDIRGLVVFFHGMDRDESVLDADEPHRALTATLADAGYAVVASRAGGNVWGNAASQQAYSQLAYGSAEHYRTTRVFFLAESMGAVAAINLLAKNQFQVSGVAAINPLLNLGSLTRKYFQQAGAANTGQPLSAVDPMQMSPASMKGKNLRLYVTPDDTVVPTEPNITAFRKRFGSVADISIVTCSGEHMDPSCIQGKDIVEWYNSLDQ